MDRISAHLILSAILLSSSNLARWVFPSGKIFGVRPREQRRIHYWECKTRTVGLFHKMRIKRWEWTRDQTRSNEKAAVHSPALDNTGKMSASEPSATVYVGVRKRIQHRSCCLLCLVLRVYVRPRHSLSVWSTLPAFTRVTRHEVRRLRTIKGGPIIGLAQLSRPVPL